MCCWPLSPAGVRDDALSRRVLTIDTIILAVGLLSFLGLIVSWLALPASTSTEATAHLVTHGA
jgi:hypothetical protein